MKLFGLSSLRSPSAKDKEVNCAKDVASYQRQDSKELHMKTDRIFKVFGLVALIGCFMESVLAQTPQTEEKPVIEGPVKNDAKGIQVFTVSSPYTGGKNNVEVLLPDKLEPGRKYPVLYVLPVGGDFGGQYGDQIQEVRKSDAHNRYGVICVSMAFDTVPWYGSHATDKKIRHDDYIKLVIVPLIEKSFPASQEPKDRLLIGFSKSGWGAVSLLLRNLNFFGAACSWDAPLMMDEKNLKWGSAKHFGTPEQAAPHVPVTLVKQQAAELTGKPARLAITGFNLYGADTKAFHKLLEEQKVPHLYDDTLKFKHHWESGWLPKALDLFLGKQVKPEEKK